MGADDPLRVSSTQREPPHAVTEQIEMTNKERNRRPPRAAAQATTPALDGDLPHGPPMEAEADDWANDREGWPRGDGLSHAIVAHIVPFCQGADGFETGTVDDTATLSFLPPGNGRFPPSGTDGLPSDVPAYAVLVELTPSGDADGGERPRRLGFGLPCWALPKVQGLLAAWRRKVEAKGACVKVSIFRHQASGEGWEEWTPRPAYGDAFVTAKYAEALDHHLRWIKRRVPWMAEADRMDRFHDVVVRSFEEMQAREGSPERFCLQLGFARHKAISGYRRDVAEAQRLDRLQAHVAEGLGCAEGTERAHVQSAEQLLLAGVEESERTELVQRLSGVLARYGNDRNKSVRETIAYLREVLAMGATAAVIDLAAYRKCSYAAARRSLMKVFRLMRSALPRAA